MKTKITWIVWIALLLGYLYTGGVIMSGASAALSQASTKPDAVKPLDLYKSGFTEAELRTEMENMGKEGRKVYLEIETHEDIIYPLVYAAFLSFTLFILAQFLFTSPWPRRSLLWLPILAMIFDIIENHYLVMILQKYPDFEVENVAMASMANQAKWGLAFISMLGILVMAILSLFKIRKSRAQ